MTGTWLGIAAGLLVIGGWTVWMRRMNQVRIPRNRAAFFLVFGAGVVLGVAALVAGAGLVGGLAAALAILGGGMFFGLRLQSSQDRREPAVTVGGPILHFSAPDDAGDVFALSSLRGRPFLLKFFRGHW
jgi:cytochrome oxidase Cu insertion factor (SCO1/SenC/PrrC family)